MTHPQAIEPAPACARWQGFAATVFFVLYFLLLWWIIDPRLLHHSIGIFTPSLPFSLSLGWSILAEHLARPGGFVEYLARWLAQLISMGLVGAFLLTVAAWLTCLAIDAIDRCRDQTRGMVIRYMPALLLLTIWGSYSVPLRSVLALLVGLGHFMLYLTAGRNSAAQRVIVLLAGSVTAYWLAGPGGLLFPLLVSISELLVERRWRFAVAALLFGSLVPWCLGVLYGQLDVAQAYGWRWPVGAELSIGARRCLIALYAFFPAYLVLSALWKNLLAQRMTPVQVRWSFLLALVLALAAGVGWYTLDVRKKIVLLIDYCAQHEQWTEALAAADRMPKGLYNVRCNRNVMLALCHTGQLGDKMFRYPQLPGFGLYSMPETERGPHSYYQEARLFLELGQVNLAEKWASEAFECEGDLPVVLRQLALINIVKERPETARMFLTALSKKPLHRREALDMRERLANNPRLENDPQIGAIRESMVSADTVANRSVEDMLLSLLQRNPDNRMAFELLMAHFLQTCRPDKLVYWLEQPTGFEYDVLPRHYQEAIVIYTLMAKQQFPAADDHLDQAVIDDAIEMDQILRAYGKGDPRTKAAATAAGFGDSYYFYFNFHTSGL